MKRAPAGALFYRLQLGPSLGLVYLKRKPARRLARFCFELMPFFQAPFPCKPGPRAAGRDPWIIARRTIRAALVAWAGGRELRPGELRPGELRPGELFAWAVGPGPGVLTRGPIARETPPGLGRS